MENAAGDIRRRSGQGLAAVTLLAVVLASGCAAADSVQSTATTPPHATASSAAQATIGTFALTTAWPDNGVIPVEYGCNGARHSPPIAWNGAPAGTAELVLIMVDYGASITHWVVVGFPGASGGSLPEGFAQAPTGPAQSYTYLAPCPGAGVQDEYIITLYALSSPLAAGNLSHMAPEVRQAAVLDAINGHELAEAAVAGFFSGGPG
jgi:phosphatidylethanolamine-binding protein (PEBP) family uncharacterized protein